MPDTSQIISLLSLAVALGALLVSVMAYNRAAKKEDLEDIQKLREAVHRIDGVLESALHISLNSLFDKKDKIYSDISGMSKVISEIAALYEDIDKVTSDISQTPLYNLSPVLSECSRISLKFSKFDHGKLENNKGKSEFFEDAQRFFVRLYRLAAEVSIVREKSSLLDEKDRKSRYIKTLDNWTRMLNVYASE
jgi:hypothetical protein